MSASSRSTWHGTVQRQHTAAAMIQLEPFAIHRYRAADISHFKVKCFAADHRQITHDGSARLEVDIAANHNELAFDPAAHADPALEHNHVGSNSIRAGDLRVSVEAAG